MASIPISEYIDISSRVLVSGNAALDFGGVVFCTTDMIESEDPDAKQTDYEAGKPVVLSKDEVTKYFEADSDIAVFAAKYFSYGTASGNPSAITVVNTLERTPLTAYNDTLNATSNFGSFTFIGSGFTYTNLLAVAQANAQNGFLMVVSVAKTAIASVASFKGIKGVHIVLDDAWMPMAWYACANYTGTNATATIDYKDFGEPTTVIDTLSDKQTLNAARINFVGKVQSHGINRKFYQNGKNADGVDIGVFRDEVWIKYRVAAGWFDLAGNANKIPASLQGEAMVEGMILGVVTQAIDNGAILVTKTFDEVTRMLINQYAGNTNAADAVQTAGYYLAARIVQEGEDYVCRYTLIYAKGDHIGKVIGSHVLV